MSMSFRPNPNLGRELERAMKSALNKAAKSVKQEIRVPLVVNTPGDVLLDEHQGRLLEMLVEADRNVPREKRTKFMFIETMEASFLRHPGLPDQHASAYEGDLDVLNNAGLINVSSSGGGTLLFDVSPFGFKFYGDMKLKIEQPIERIESHTIHFLERDGFQGRFPVAFSKWKEAEKLLWCEDVKTNLSTIGHLCREALQEYSEVVSKRFGGETSDVPKDKTKVKIDVAIQRIPSRTTRSFLSNYWNGVNGLVQRLEHSGLAEGEELSVNDSRRVVFQCALVFMELDSELSKIDN